MAHPTRNVLAWEPLADEGAVPVLLIRHAQTAWNRERRMLGRSDIPLDEEGKAQALALAEWLAPVPLSRVASSPLSRAVMTAAPLAEPRGLSVELAPGLVELDQGELDGHVSVDLLAPYADFFAAWLTDPVGTRIPGGETLGECLDRGWDALSTLLGDSQPGPPIAVVMHQMVLCALLCRASGTPLRSYSKFSQRNTSVNLLAWRDGALRLVEANRCEHLPPLPPPSPPPRRSPV